MSIFDIVFLGSGIILMLIGTKVLVDATISSIKYFNVSDWKAGFLFVALGSTFPELIVNFTFSFSGESSLIIPNILGSTNYNLFIILGIAGLFSSVLIPKKTLAVDLPVLAICTLLLFIFFNQNFFEEDVSDNLTTLEALSLIAILVLLYLSNSFKVKTKREEKSAPTENRKPWKTIAYGLIGLILLVFGSWLSLEESKAVINYLNIDKQAISFFLIAPITTLPEFMTTIVASLKRQYRLAISNIIGANIYNLLLVLPLTCLSSGAVYDKVLNFDLSLHFLGVLFVIFSVPASKQKKWKMWQSILFILISAFYLVFIFNRATS